MKALDNDEIQKRVSKLPANWFVGSDGRLSTQYSFDSVAQAKKFINDVIDTSEDLNHHPDLTWVYTKVDIAISTHDAQGLTDLDFKFAAKVEECLRKL